MAKRRADAAFLRGVCWRYLNRKTSRHLILTYPELLAFLDVQGRTPQSKDLPAEVLIPPLGVLSSRWSEPSQVEYLQSYCQNPVTDAARAVMIVLRLLTIRVEISRQRFNLKQAQSWGVDCLVRIWALMGRWKLLPHLRSACHVVAGSYLRTLDTLCTNITAQLPERVLAFKIATLYSRSVVELVQVCLTGSHPRLEKDLCTSLVELLRLSRTSTFIHATGEILLPSLRELTKDELCTQPLGRELQVDIPELENWFYTNTNCSSVLRRWSSKSHSLSVM